MSTNFPGEACRHLDTAATSWALPAMTVRLGVVEAGKMDVSLAGTRQSAMQWWPAASVVLSAARPTPALAPKNATVLPMVKVFKRGFGAEE